MCIRDRLTAYKYANTSRISGGQKQRLAIASSMAMTCLLYTSDHIQSNGACKQYEEEWPYRTRDSL